MNSSNHIDKILTLTSNKFICTVARLIKEGAESSGTSSYIDEMMQTLGTNSEPMSLTNNLLSLKCSMAGVLLKSTLSVVLHLPEQSGVMCDLEKIQNSKAI